MNHGVVQQADAPLQLYRRPANRFVAGFIGSPPMNLIPARLANGALFVAGHHVADATGYHWPDGDVVLGIRPSHLRPVDNGVSGRLLLSENLGENMLLNIDVAGEIVKVRLPDVRHLADGETINLAFDPGFLHLFDPVSHRRIDRTA
ncbi:MAG: TOBE domain-containing protein, partial [Rhodobacteraceae bacterium]|nr:TOBE domain-containing protein [Paracoccaceae bacterium]